MLNTAAAMVLFLLGSFALMFAFVETPAIQYYTGGVIIALFIAGLIYAWGNSIIQTRRLEDELKAQKTAAAPASTTP
jgi:hypothetical protein